MRWQELGSDRMSNLKSELIKELDGTIALAMFDIYGPFGSRKPTKLDTEALNSLCFSVDVLNNKSVFYRHLGKFKAILRIMKEFIEHFDSSEYEKGKIVEMFLKTPILDKSLKSITIDDEKAFNVLGKDREIAELEIKASIDECLINPNTTKLEQGLKSDIIKFLEETREDNFDFKYYYEEFRRKYLNIDDNFSLEGLKEILAKLEVPSELIDYYYAYCSVIYDKKQKNKKTFIVKEEKKEIKKEKTYSKKELKNELLKYCDLKSDKPFDYHNYKQVLELLKKLQFADNINERYFNYCNINMVENNAYYNMLFNKIKNKKEYADIVDRVYSIREKMFICSEEEYDAYLKEIFQVLDMVDDCEMLNFDYEMTRVRKK